MTYLLVVLLSIAGTYTYSEYACSHKPIDLKAAERAYYARLADGPKRDRLLVAIQHLQEQVDRQRELLAAWNGKQAAARAE